MKDVMAYIKKKGAPFKEIRAESFLHIRCTRADKAKWVRESQGNGGLSTWVINLLNRECAKNEN